MDARGPARVRPVTSLDRSRCPAEEQQTGYPSDRRRRTVRLEIRQRISAGDMTVYGDGRGEWPFTVALASVGKVCGSNFMTSHGPSLATFLPTFRTFPPSSTWPPKYRNTVKNTGPAQSVDLCHFASRVQEHMLTIISLQIMHPESLILALDPVERLFFPNFRCVSRKCEYSKCQRMGNLCVCNNPNSHDRIREVRAGTDSIPR